MKCDVCGSEMELIKKDKVGNSIVKFWMCRKCGKKYIEEVSSSLTLFF